jgi:outer membrane immunogenic protein
MKKVRTHLLATAAVVALSGSVFAADMGLPVKAPAPPPIPYSSWQGWYIGGLVGAARMNSSCTLTDTNIDFLTNAPCGGGNPFGGGTGSQVQNSTAALAGVQVGYDWQNRSFVYGVAADWTWTGLKQSQTPSSFAATIPFLNTKVEWLASFRGRMGLAFEDTLVYFTGGLALGQIKDSAGLTGTCCGDWTASVDQVRVGWVAGAGVEHKFSQNWSLVGEFLYYDLGHVSASGTSPDGDFSYSTQFAHEVFVGRVGLNYRF